MTRDEILNMPAGREMDALIRRALFHSNTDARCPVCGWPMGNERWQCQPGDCSMRPAPVLRWDDASPRYSTDIGAAWMVVNELIDRDLPWDAGCSTYQGFYCDFSVDDAEYLAHAETLPLAICRAALLAAEEVTGG